MAQRCRRRKGHTSRPRGRPASTRGGTISKALGVRAAIVEPLFPREGAEEQRPGVAGRPKSRRSHGG